MPSTTCCARSPRPPSAVSPPTPGNWPGAWRHSISAKGFGARRLTPTRTALTAARRTADLEAQAQSHRGLANAHLRQGNPGQAQDHYLKSYRLFQQLGDQFHQGVLHLNIGLVLESQGRLREALDRAQRAYQMFDIAGVTGRRRSSR